jgi:hypothetical protein
MSASAGAAESSNPGRCHARWGFGGSGASSERAGDAEGEGGVGSRVGTVLLIRHPWDVVRSRMMQTGRSLNRPRRASHDGAHNGGTPPPPTKTTTATTSSTTTTRACSGLHFLDIDALCYSSIYVFRRPPAWFTPPKLPSAGGMPSLFTKSYYEQGEEHTGISFRAD